MAAERDDRRRVRSFAGDDGAELEVESSRNPEHVELDILAHVEQDRAGTLTFGGLVRGELLRCRRR